MMVGGGDYGLLVRVAASVAVNESGRCLGSIIFDRIEGTQNGAPESDS
jgi:hypothetical protein